MPTKYTQILTLVFMRGSHWLLQADTPPVFSIDNPHGWTVLNPLLGVGVVADCITLPVVDGSLFVSTKQMSFIVPQPTTTDVQMAEGFLRKLRYETGQASLPLEVAGTAYLTLETLPTHIDPVSSDSVRVIVHDYKKRVAITPESIRNAGANKIDHKSYYYSQVLLDGIQAMDEGDFKKAILYSAIATEAMAATILDEEYARLQQTAAPQPHLRITSHVINKKHTIKRDPIYESLRKLDRFSYKLNHLPLYLLGRSLLTDDKPLYDRALDLYNARNKLVHVNARPDPPRIPTDRTGAKEALDISRRVFSWFGAPGKYELPD